MRVRPTADPSAVANEPGAVSTAVYVLGATLVAVGAMTVYYKSQADHMTQAPPPRPHTPPL